MASFSMSLTNAAESNLGVLRKSVSGILLGSRRKESSRTSVISLFSPQAKTTGFVSPNSSCPSLSEFSIYCKTAVVCFQGADLHLPPLSHCNQLCTFPGPSVCVNHPTSSCQTYFCYCHLWILCISIYPYIYMYIVMDRKAEESLWEVRLPHWCLCWPVVLSLVSVCLQLWSLLLSCKSFGLGTVLLLCVQKA